MSKNIALVLSGGGARGYAHIGALKVLVQHGFNITSIAGTSMGALVGGIFATGQLQQFEEWVLSLDIMEVLKLTDFSISSKGLVKGKKVIDRIKQIVPDRNIEDLPIPFCAIATDIINGTEAIFTNGNLYDAIRASISIPTVFQPLQINDHYFVDGGLLNPIPVNRVKRHEGDMLFVVDVCSPIPYEKKNDEQEPLTGRKQAKQINLIQGKTNNIIPTKKNEELGIFNLTNRSIATMMRKISEFTLEKHHPDLLINISKESFNIYDFYKAKEIIKEGELATLSALQQNGAISKNP
jgi:NTE family protein